MAWLALVGLLLAATAAGGDPCADLRFTETAAEAGVVFTHDPGGLVEPAPCGAPKPQ